MNATSQLSYSIHLRQRGAATLAVTLMLLAIITIVVLFATSTAYFEQRTVINENRARLAEQAAEYGVNIGGEYVKSQLDKIVSDSSGGWMNSSSSLKWSECEDVGEEDAEFPANHPCLSEIANSAGGQRNEMYFITLADDTDAVATNDVEDRITEGALANVGGTADFPVETKIDALLCRIDTSDPANPHCDLNPTSGRNIAVTLIATAQMEDENASATVKETWSTYSTFTPASTVPLVASGVVKGLGNGQIVASPNAGGYGLAVSIWSSNEVDVDGSTGGAGSVTTCHLGGYLGEVPVSNLLTTCSGNGSTGCGCPNDASDHDFLSGHPSGGATYKSEDILDTVGNSVNPAITFFPGNAMDDPADPSDDNLFEWIFGVDYVSKATDGNVENDGNGDTSTNCPFDFNNNGTAGESPFENNCAIYAMHEDLGFEFVTCAQLSALGANASGLYYVYDSYGGTGCGLPNQVGSADDHAVVVVDNFATVGAQTRVFGMLFVRRDVQTTTEDANGAEALRGNGSAQVFGSVVVQGSVKLTGGIDIVYYDWAAAANDPENPPPASYFGRVAGSWLDDDTGF